MSLFQPIWKMLYVLKSSTAPTAKKWEWQHHAGKFLFSAERRKLVRVKSILDEAKNRHRQTALSFSSTFKMYMLSDILLQGSNNNKINI